MVQKKKNASEKETGNQLNWGLLFLFLEGPHAVPTAVTKMVQTLQRMLRDRDRKEVERHTLHEDLWLAVICATGA